MANTRRRYSKEEKAEVLSEIETGKSIAEVAESRQMSQATIRQWTRPKKSAKEITSPSPVTTAEGIKAELAKYDQRISDLKAQIEQVEKEKQAYKDNLKAILESITE